MTSTFFNAVLLPLALAIIMLGLGLSLTLNDFKRIVKYPKAMEHRLPWGTCSS